MPHMQALTPEGLIADARAAFDWLQKIPRVLPNATASVGYCMGGRVSFLANSELPLKAAVSFYGGGIAPALLPRAAQQQADSLFLGALDSHIPKEHIRAIMDAMQAKKTTLMSRFADADTDFLRRASSARGNRGEASLGTGAEVSFDVREGGKVYDWWLVTGD